MKLLILGRSGQLGRSLLVEKNVSYEIYSPSSTEVDVTNFESTRQYLLNLQPNYVLNATAWTDVPGAENFPEKAYLLNADAVANLATLCKELKATLVHVSTDYVFNGAATSPYREGDQTAPLNEYGKSKLAGENAVFESGLENFYVVRTSWLYSKYGKNFVTTIASKALKGESASITDDQFGSPTFAGDLAAGLFSLIVNNPNSGTYNYSNGDVTSWYEFGRAIYELAGVNPALVSPRKSETSEIRRPAYSPLDLSKWQASGLSEIRNWKVALETELPAIIDEIKRAEM